MYIVILQDPSQPDHRMVNQFYHVKQEEDNKKENNNINMRFNSSLQKMMTEVKENAEKRKKEEEEKRQQYIANRPRSENVSSAYVSSLTSTTVVADEKYGYATDEEIQRKRYERVRSLKKKGYVTLVTSMGNLNLELHCDLVPMTCENFLTLCEQGKYNNLVFHRLIKNFMIQGGDPTGTGTGGSSMWNKPFKDEFHHSLVHKGLGIVSMANSGPDTNGSQFFITFKSAPHLDNKHSIFGRVVGGLENLKKMEMVKTDKNDRPCQPIMIAKTIVLQNPFHEVDEMIQRDIAAEGRKREKPSEPTVLDKKAGVSQYLNPDSEDEMREDEKKEVLEMLKQQELQHTENAVQQVKKKRMGGFGNFSSW